MTVVIPIGKGRTAAGAPRERVGVLLVNLGTPDTADARGLRVYLKEFLSDPRVIEKQGLIWKLALNGVILNTRPRRKARDYLKIWNTERERIAAQDHHARAVRQARGCDRRITTTSSSIGRCVMVIRRCTRASQR